MTFEEKMLKDKLFYTVNVLIKLRLLIDTSALVNVVPEVLKNSSSVRPALITSNDQTFQIFGYCKQTIQFGLQRFE